MQDDFQALPAAQTSGSRIARRRHRRACRSPRGSRIYSDGYCLRLIEALQANYPALAKLLGDEEFATLGAAYVQRQRFALPIDPLLRRRACRIFWRPRADYAKAPLLADLARWEWTMTEVFDAADATPIGVERSGRRRAGELGGAAV